MTKARTFLPHSKVSWFWCLLSFFVKNFIVTWPPPESEPGRVGEEGGNKGHYHYDLGEFRAGSANEAYLLPEGNSHNSAAAACRWPMAMLHELIIGKGLCIQNHRVVLKMNCCKRILKKMATLLTHWTVTRFPPMQQSRLELNVACNVVNV